MSKHFTFKLIEELNEMMKKTDNARLFLNFQTNMNFEKIS